MTIQVQRAQEESLKVREKGKQRNKDEGEAGRAGGCPVQGERTLMPQGHCHPLCRLRSGESASLKHCKDGVGSHSMLSVKTINQPKMEREPFLERQ